MRTIGALPFIAAVIFAAPLLWPVRAASQGAPQNSPDFYNAGVEHIAAERWPEAVDVLKQAIKQDPKDADAHFKLGYVLMQLKQYAEAVKAYRQTVRINPLDAKAYTHLGGRPHISERISRCRRSIRQRREAHSR
jgi:Flp pilus assembly protein TadD